MAVQEIALLGNPVLRTQCKPVRSSNDPIVRKTVADLRDTLAEFRKKRGFGRGIAAPQIGVPLRIIYIDFEWTGPLINPTITKSGRKKFRLWDDCFSFPDLLVFLERHYSIEVSFQNESGKRETLKAAGSLAELLQHEIDHLNGILAIDRAIDSKHIILRSEYEKMIQENAARL
jgi:peptide deformylase